MPDNSNPLHDTNYIKSCTSDMFGVCLEAKDDKFEEGGAIKLLTEFGATGIETIYYDESAVQPIFTKKFIIFLICAAVFASGTVYFVTNKLMFMVPYTWMMNQDRISAQATSDFFKDGFGMRPQVDGTVAQNFMPKNLKIFA